MRAAELVRALESLTLPKADFHHREHIQASVYYLRTYGYPGARAHILTTIASYAASNGYADAFHVTLTSAWLQLVGATLHAERSARSFDEFVERHPELMDKSALLRFYSRERLFADDARRRWIAPDLEALPACPPHRGTLPWD